MSRGGEAAGDETEGEQGQAMTITRDRPTAETWLREDAHPGVGTYRLPLGVYPWQAVRVRLLTF